MSVEAIVGKMREHLQQGGFDRSVKLDLGEDGVILIDGGTISTADGEAECTITLSRADLEQLIAGELDPVSAFMSGRIQIDGDMSAAMALTSAI